MLSFQRALNSITVAAFLSMLTTGISYAVDDGFSAEGKIEGKHFTVYYAPGVFPAELNQQLNLGVAESLLTGRSTERVFSAEAELANALDTIFTEVCNILDMQLYSFHGHIKICRGYAQLNTIYRDFFHKDLGTRSFYAYNLNTIYTSADNFKLGIIGHEIAHLIISHYFIVLPSVRVQEVLAMYVEYQLKRAVQ